jgi:hypothetical protein
MMKLQIAAGLVVATFIGLGTTSANAVNKPVSLPQVTSQVQQVACSGNRRTYTDFAHCMRVNKGSSAAKYCSKICS